MSYQLLQSNWKSNGKTSSWEVYLYPNKPEHDDLVDTYKHPLINAGEQLLSADAIGSYFVYVSYEHPKVNSLLGKQELLKKFIDYDGPNNKNSTPGAHGLLTDPSWGGIAEAFDTPEDGEPDANNEYFGWEVSANWLVGWNGSAADKYKNAAIQEPSHNFINNQNEDVKQLTEDDGVDESTGEDTGERDHGLGTVINNEGPCLDASESVSPPGFCPTNWPICGK